MKHKHLTYEQRYSIEIMLKTKINKKDIYESLGIPSSTFYRELKRNSKPRSYQAKHAQMLADERKREQHMKTYFTSSVQELIDSKLHLYWSPEQIKGWCNKNNIEMVSHTRIYQYIKQDKTLGGDLYKFLRHKKRYKKKYGSTDKRGKIPDKVPIESRPKEVEAKQRIGDFEIDLIIGK